MKVPEALGPLFDEGVIQDVIRPLMSGKEAQIYLVVADGRHAVAKVYKEAENRSFKHRSAYTEGRRVRNSRQQRAMEKGSRFGKEQIEDAWRSAEVDAIYRLRAHDVRVPEPYFFLDGVLVMELVQDRHGEPAPRLADIAFDEQEARALFLYLVREVCKMLCAGIVHGDLSDFNVLMGVDGPVIIDFPQASDPAQNRNARKLLVRDVDNLTSFLSRFAPDLKKTRYGAEMWDIYERGQLLPDTPLSGRFKKDDKHANVSALLREIDDVAREVAQRREALGLPMRPARAPKVAVETREAPPQRPPQRQQRPDPRPKQKQQPVSDDPFDDLDALLSAGPSRRR
jgi:RIO kinase 1